MTPRDHRVIVRPEAEADILNAASWYERQTPNLGYELVVEIEFAILAAARNPFRFPCLRRKPEVRRVLTKRFPYRVFFIRRKDEIVVFRILHGARDEAEWKSNIPKDPR